MGLSMESLSLRIENHDQLLVDGFEVDIDFPGVLVSITMIYL